MNDDKQWVEQVFGELAARSRARLAMAMVETEKDIEQTANAVYARLGETRSWLPEGWVFQGLVDVSGEAPDAQRE